MSDWKDVIKGRLDQHLERKKEVTTVLQELLSELEQHPYNLRVKLSTGERDQLSWLVFIGNKQVEINESEISGWQVLYDDDHNPTDSKRDLKSTLKDLLVNEFNWQGQKN